MPNLLSHQSSSYLRMHADQPVDWYPWGHEALDRARREDKPILLSIGYAACHWCHVMARESFSDPSTAALMNEGFINIKVDREEHPEIDQLYQNAHQILRRSGGGWPLTIFLSPQGIPFYSGTYFPHAAQAGQAAFKDILGSVSTIWHDKRQALARQDQAVLAALSARQPQPHPGIMLDSQVQAQAVQQLALAFDTRHGGFGNAPKFPHPTDLAFLLERGRTANDAQARHMALSTLRKMAEGGLYDQVGGGFFRYSVDAAWRIPHFEKMLCDNALLIEVYAEAWHQTHEAVFLQVVEQTVDWALRDMQATSGAFRASLPADDAQGVEGGLYTWKADTIRELLSPQEWDVCSAHWGLIDPPNMEGQFWHLRVARPMSELGRFLERPPAVLAEYLVTARPKLLAERAKRPLPTVDEQHLTSWNALMIRALTRAAQRCDRPQWLQAARAATTFIGTQRVGADGRLLCLPGQDAFLDDHAFLMEALLTLHAAVQEPELLTWASQLADALLAHFEDRHQGGFYFTRHDAPPLFFRMKTGNDTATPSGNASAVIGLQRLATVLGEPRYAEAARRCLTVFAAQVADDPASHPCMLEAAALSQPEVVLPA